jgi:hypothetical protein
MNLKIFNIEMIFKKDIIKYSTNLFNKVKNWETFCNIYHFINDDNLKKETTLLKNLSDLVNLIDNKYRAIKENKNDLNNLQDEKLKIFIETLSAIDIFMFDNKKDFFPKIKQLSEESQNKIYIELYPKYYNHSKYKNIIEQIKDYYIKQLKPENLDYFINFIVKLENDDCKDMMDLINNKYKISEIDFNKTFENINIILICKLNDKGLIKEENNYYNNSIHLEELYKGIEEKKIQIKQIKSLFDCNKENVKEKFKLFILIKERNIDENLLYDNLKCYYNEINDKSEKLKCLSSNLEKYLSKFYENEIKEMNSYISKIENGTYQDYENIRTNFLDSF